MRTPQLLAADQRCCATSVATSWLFFLAEARHMEGQFNKSSTASLMPHDGQGEAIPVSPGREPEQYTGRASPVGSASGAAKATAAMG